MAITNIRPNPFVPEYQEEIIEDAAARRVKMLFEISTALDDGEDGDNSLEDALANLKNVLIDDSEEEEEPYVDLKFAYNPGAFTINKAPEDITVQDVIDAYELEDLFDGIPLLDVNTDNDSDIYPYVLGSEKITTIPDESAPSYIITGEALGLIWGKEVNGVEVPYYTYNKKTWNSWANTQMPIETSINIQSEILQEHKALLGKSSTVLLNDIGIYNDGKIRNLKSNCTGLKLRHIYPISCPKSKYSSSVSATRTNPVIMANVLIPLKGDFIIDGEVNGEAVGGFYSKAGVLYTEYSLYLHKVNWIKSNAFYYSIFVNCGNPVVKSMDNGIEQLKVDGCVFQGLSNDISDPHNITNAQDSEHNYGEYLCRDGKSYAGKYFYLYFTDKNVWDNNKYSLIEGNNLKHTLFYDNVFYGTNCIGGDIERYSETFRFVNNCFYIGTMSDNFRNHYYVYTGEYWKWDLCDGAILLGAGNALSYYPFSIYYSCPMWFVGNKFYGSTEITSYRNKGNAAQSGYYCGILTESSTGYVLRNIFKNFVTRTCLTTTPKSLCYYGRPEVYDCYLSNPRVYSCNNHITNVFYITPLRGEDIGIAKGKNLNIPTSYKYSDFYDTIRYFKYNVYDVDKEWLDAAWVRGVQNEQFYGEDTFLTSITTTENRNEILEAYRIEDVLENGTIKSVTAAESKTEWPLDLPVGTKPTTYKMFGEKSWDRAMSIIENINGEDVVTGVNPDFVCYQMSAFASKKGSAKENYVTIVARKYTFSNNTFNMGECCIGGMRSNSYLHCVEFVCQDNEFKASKVVSSIGNSPKKELTHQNAFWQSRLCPAFDTYSDQALFTILPWDLYKARWNEETKTIMRDTQYNPSITVTGNKFYIDSQQQSSQYVSVWARLLHISVHRKMTDFQNLTGTEIKAMANYSINKNEGNYIGAIITASNNIVSQPESSSTRNGIVISIKDDGSDSYGTPIVSTEAVEIIAT